jgi:O-antigen/teichoic acid export membrane protein
MEANAVRRLTVDEGMTDAAAVAAPALRIVLRNIASLTLAYVLPRVCTFAAAVVAARALGVAAFGAWGSAAAIAVIMSVTATLGMMQLLIREIARTPDRAATLVGAANLAKLFTTLLMLVSVAILTTGPLGWDRPAVLAALLLSLAYGVGAFAENLGAWFQGIERMEVWMQAQTMYGVATGGFGIAFAVITRDLVWFCAAPVIGQTAACAWLIARAPASIRRAWTAPASEVRGLIRALLPFAAAFLLLTAFYKVDILLLERWRGMLDAGLYAASYRFVDVAQALAVVIATALYPRLSRLGDRPGRPAARTLELMALASVPAASLLWIVREPLVSALFGTGYAGAGEALGWLAPALPFLAMNALATFVLAASGRASAVARAYAAGLLVNVALNALWIPGLGAAGAARAMLVSEVALCGLLLSVASRSGARFRLRTALPLAAAAAAALLVALSALPPVAGALVYAPAIVLVYGVFRVLPAGERAVLRQALVR